MISAGAGDKQQDFKVHWETLTTAFEYFASMRKAKMAEVLTDSVSFPEDDPQAWRSLLQNCYSPTKSKTVEDAILTLPLLKFLSAIELLDEAETFIRTCSLGLRF